MKTLPRTTDLYNGSVGMPRVTLGHLFPDNSQKARMKYVQKIIDEPFIFVTPDQDLAQWYARSTAKQCLTPVDPTFLQTFTCKKECHFIDLYNPDNWEKLCDVFKSEPKLLEMFNQSMERVERQPIEHEMQALEAIAANAALAKIQQQCSEGLSEQEIEKRFMEEATRVFDLLTTQKGIGFRTSRCEHDYAMSEYLCNYFKRVGLQCDGFCCEKRGHVEYMICTPQSCLESTRITPLNVWQQGETVVTENALWLIAHVLPPDDIYKTYRYQLTNDDEETRVIHSGLIQNYVYVQDQQVYLPANSQTTCYDEYVRATTGGKEPPTNLQKMVLNAVAPLQSTTNAQQEVEEIFG